MSRWSKRSESDKKRIMAEQAGYPLAGESLEKKLNEMDEFKRTDYMHKWISYHRSLGYYDNDILDKIWGRIHHAEKLNAIFSLPGFQGERFDDYVKFMTMRLFDEHSDENEKKMIRAAMCEILGPDAMDVDDMFADGKLPDDYKPSWTVKPPKEDDDSKPEPVVRNEKNGKVSYKTVSKNEMLSQPDKEEIVAKSVTAIDLKKEAKRICLDEIGKDICRVCAGIIKGGKCEDCGRRRDGIGKLVAEPKPVKDDWEIAMNRSIMKKHRIKAKPKKVKKKRKVD